MFGGNNQRVFWSPEAKSRIAARPRTSPIIQDNIDKKWHQHKLYASESDLQHCRHQLKD